MLNYKKEQLEEYKKELGIVASLSNLYSDNTAPMIYYRATENIYCRSFGALNVSRSDCTADAIFSAKIGVGIKTFLYQPLGGFQKIAEFNKQRPLFKDLSGIELIKKIAALRNERIETTVRTYGLQTMVYHCITRKQDGTIDIFEEPMNSIIVDKISILGTDDIKIVFTDGQEKYEFYYSKSTLFKMFRASSSILSFKVTILDDPMESLTKLFDFLAKAKSQTASKNQLSFPSLIVPLYSENKKRGRFVPEKSGLNQWNAKGRVRKYNEVYIPFPKRLRKENPNFFPPRKTKWELELPTSKKITMSVCQESGKALMSKPNGELGQWILRDVLNLAEGHLLSYDELLAKGIDSVIFRKIDDLHFKCDFISNETLDE